MRVLAALIVALPFLLPGRNVLSAEPDPHPGPVELVVGYSANVFVDVDMAEARSVTKVWSDHILKRKFKEGTAQSLIFPDTESLEKAFRERKVDLAAIVSNEYILIKDRVPIQPVFVTASDDGFYHQIVLVVRRDGGIRQLRELRRRQLILSKDQSRTLHMVWLETLLMREGFRRAEEFFSYVKEVRRPSQAILPVFFKQADACLTTRRSFDLACEMNPQVGRELMVLAQSPDLAGGVIVFRPTYEEKHKELMMEVLEKLEEDPQGKQLLKLFRMSRLHPFKPEYLMTVETLFRQHDTLRVALVKGK